MKRCLCGPLFIGIVLVSAAAKAIVPAAPTSPFEVVLPQMPIDVHSDRPFETVIAIRIPDGHYLYADKVELLFQSLEGVQIQRIQYPPSTKKKDEFVGEVVQVYTQDVAIAVSGRVPPTLPAGIKELVATLSLQGCTPKLCLRPEEREVLLQLNVVPAPDPAAPSDPPAPPAQGTPQSSWRDLLFTSDFSAVMALGLPLIFLITFLAGVLTSLTPCVWPVIPLVLAIIGIHPEHRLRKNVALSLSLIAGMVLVYALLGLAAAGLGKGLGFLFQSKMFLLAVAVFFLLMSLSLFGLFHLSLPQSVQQALHALGGKGYRGAFLAGLGTGLIASPCVGPIIAALLAYVALQRDYAFGFILLVVYGAGMGLLFVVLATGYATVADRLKGGPWMAWVKRLLGIGLLIPAAFYFGVVFDVDVGRLMKRDSARIGWYRAEPQAIDAARSSRKPIMIDFYADWCPPCRELDRKFFSRDDIAALANDFVMLRVDATLINDEVERVADKYGVVGWPTIIFASPDGQKYDDLTVTSYAPNRLKEAMRQAIDRTTSDGVRP